MMAAQQHWLAVQTLVCMQPVNNALRQQNARLGTAPTAYVPKFCKAVALMKSLALPD